MVKVEIYILTHKKFNEEYDPAIYIPGVSSVIKKVKYLIVDGAESEIYASADSAIMYNHQEEILECIDTLMKIMDI